MSEGRKATLTLAHMQAGSTLADRPVRNCHGFSFKLKHFLFVEARTALADRSGKKHRSRGYERASAAVTAASTGQKVS